MTSTTAKITMHQSPPVIDDSPNNLWIQISYVWKTYIANSVGQELLTTPHTRPPTHNNPTLPSPLPLIARTANLKGRATRRRSRRRRGDGRGLNAPWNFLHQLSTKKNHLKQVEISSWDTTYGISSCRRIKNLDDEIIRSSLLYSNLTRKKPRV